MKKDDVIKSIDTNKQYSGKHTLSLVESVTSIDNITPKYLKVGDIISYPVSMKKRPCLVIGKVNNDIIVISLSTTKDHNYLMDTKSRFLPKESYVCKSIFYTTNDTSCQHYICDYDNKQHVREIIKKVKEYYSQFKIF